jgi:hypothetical protein
MSLTVMLVAALGVLCISLWRMRVGHLRAIGLRPPHRASDALGEPPLSMPDGRLQPTAMLEND